MSVLYVYEVMPVDSGWHWMTTVDDLFGLYQSMADSRSAADELSVLVEKAESMARDLGWDGENRHEPRVFFVPVEGTMAMGLIWKQDNNGTTYVASPVKMPHLEDASFLSVTPNWISR